MIRRPIARLRHSYARRSKVGEDRLLFAIPSTEKCALLTRQDYMR
jgi:hypothetical protein